MGRGQVVVSLDEWVPAFHLFAFEAVQNGHVLDSSFSIVFRVQALV